MWNVNFYNLSGKYLNIMYLRMHIFLNPETLFFVMYPTERIIPVYKEICSRKFISTWLLGAKDASNLKKYKNLS